jgi:glycerol-3-phosphate dehydrogenase
VALQLVARYGTESPAVVALGAELDLLRPLLPNRAFLEVEVAWAARYELALSLDDVLSRRTRLSPELADRGATVAPRVAAILGAELGWGGARQALEVQTYLASARREFSVPPPSGPAPVDTAEPAVD